MILTCPQCAARYLVDAAAIGTTGRLVRCARCGHTWHVHGPAPAGPGETPEPHPEIPAGVRPESERISARWEEPRDSDETYRKGLPAFPRKRRSPILVVGWILLVLLLIGIVAGAYVFRNQIVAAVPGAAGPYQALGIEVEGGMRTKPAPEIRDEQLERMNDGANDILVLNFVLANTTEQILDVPRLRISVKDNADTEIDSYTFQPEVETLEPGETANIVYRIDNPPAEAAALSVSVVDE